MPFLSFFPIGALSLPRSAPSSLILIHWSTGLMVGSNHRYCAWSDTAWLRSIPHSLGSVLIKRGPSIGPTAASNHRYCAWFGTAWQPTRSMKQTTTTTHVLIKSRLICSNFCDRSHCSTPIFVIDCIVYLRCYWLFWIQILYMCIVFFMGLEYMCLVV